MLLAETFKRIQRSLDGGTDGPFFNVSAGNLVTLAKFVDQAGGICIWIVGLEEIIFAGENIIDASPAGLDNQRGGDTAARIHAGKKECLLDMVRVAIPCAEAGRLVRRVSQHPAHFLGVQAGRAGSSSGGAKLRCDAVCAPVTLHFKILSAESHGDAASNVIAERHGAQEMRSANLKLLSGRKRGGHNSATGMG